jgi:hypothetical protein
MYVNHLQPKPTRPILEFRVHGQAIGGETSGRAVRVSYQANAGITAADTEIYIGSAVWLWPRLCNAVFTVVISGSPWIDQKVYLDLWRRVRPEAIGGAHIPAQTVG